MEKMSTSKSPTKKKPVKSRKGIGGRPTKFTPETIQKLEEAFAWGCTDIEACLHADISKSALYYYQDEHPEFLERKEALKNKPYLLARKSIVDRMPRDPDLSLKYLERKKKDEFSLRSEVTGKDGGAIETKTVDVMDVGVGNDKAGN